MAEHTVKPFIIKSQLFNARISDLIEQQEGASLTNLSHDSGLTTSDSQLYAFDGVENNSFSSSDDLRKLSAASSGRLI